MNYTGKFYRQNYFQSTGYLKKHILQDLEIRPHSINDLTFIYQVNRKRLINILTELIEDKLITVKQGIVNKT